MSLYMDIVKQNQVYQEVYFGKSKDLEEAERILGEVRRVAVISPTKVNTSKALLDFNRKMEKIFGFEAFCLNIDYNVFMKMNAYTRPICFVIDAPNAEDSLGSNKTGFTMNAIKGSQCIVYVTYMLMKFQELTDGEVMAIIMHEIGHNFQATISPMCRGWSYFMRLVAFLSLPLQYLMNPVGGLQMVGGTRRWYTDLIDTWRKEGNSFYSFLNSLSYCMNKMVSFVAFPFNVVMAIQRLLSGIAIPIPQPQWVTNALTALPGYKQETIADNFATAYGYGPELASALSKMKYNSYGMPEDKFIRSVPVIGAIYDLEGIFITMVLSIIDEHPNNAARAHHQIEVLQKDIMKADMDPKMKKRMMMDAESLQKTVDEELDIDSLGSKGGWAYTNCWGAFLMACFQGDIRHFLANGNYDEFNAAYDRNLEAIKRAKKH